MWSHDVAGPVSKCDSTNGVLCPEGSTIERLVLRPGYWRATNLTMDVRACAAGEGQRLAANGENLTAHVNREQACLGGSTYGRCRQGQQGPVCATCSEVGTYYTNGRCLGCPHVAPQ
eukprot:4816577-Prymnesium_polylepis.2